MRTCCECGLAQIRGWNLEFVDNLYDYYSGWSNQEVEQAYNEVNAARYRAVLAEFSKKVLGRRLLDVGCGVGHFVQTANESGWQAEGIDLAEGAIDLAAQRELPCRRQDFFSSSLDDLQFDVITMWEFIEHVPSPGRFIARAEELLSPGGIIYLTTPNVHSVTRRLSSQHWPVFHPEHLSYFSPESLARVVSDACELTIFELRSANVSFSPVVRHLGDALSRVRKSDAQGDQTIKKRKKDTTRLSPEQRLRRVIAKSAMLSIAQRTVNRVLSAAHAGDTLVMTLHRPL